MRESRSFNTKYETIQNRLKLVILWDCSAENYSSQVWSEQWWLCCQCNRLQTSRFNEIIHVSTKTDWI